MAPLVEGADSHYVPDMAGASPAPRRRDEALAFIIECVARGGVTPSYGQIARRLGVGLTRAKQLVSELERLGHVARTPGAQNSIVVLDIAHGRELLVEALQRLGWSGAQSMGSLSRPCPTRQLPMLPPFEHLPDD